MTDSVLSASQVSRRFGPVAALDGASLALHRGEIAALIGPSGSGKSTLLRAMAGLEPIDAGEIREAGALVSAPGRLMPPERRRIGLVFQDFALFPHLDATANVAFGLKGRSDARQIAEGWLERVGLSHRVRAFPHQLSGGEQQRVALARALAPEPHAVLLDEPFSGLDPYLRADLQERTIEALRAAGTAALVVSHDTEEALAVADRVAVMEAGRVAQSGSPAEVHARPTSLAVARALGPIWTVDGEARSGIAETEAGPFPSALQGAVTVAIRPESTLLKADPAGRLQVRAVRGVGRHRMVHAATIDGHLRLSAYIEAELAPREGDRVRVEVHPGEAIVFPRAALP